ncbi:MAG: hypothetical protein L6R38_002532 [Xanthoria sp. 2 TBL-2021]|nr:MAG: hypothetical protein L6R38_002532 [Xanthoria sp. 2 TBL-2021]
MSSRPRNSGNEAHNQCRQFYALSKHHHPDRNPDDPHATERFVKISEAYAILGNPSKREMYDRDIGRSSQGRSHGAHRGSHSSSAPYGARPASGLSRRRTQFRGPSPSFYRSGGWGSHGAKRQRQADSAASAHASAASASSSSGTFGRGGFGPAGSPDGLDYDVPHFDRDIHIRTQEQQDQRRQQRAGGTAADYSGGENMLWKFVFVSGILAAACLIPALFDRRKSHRQSDDKT